MDQDRALTQSTFDSLLAWLDVDRDQAGKKYEFIRLRLIKIFACRGRTDAEELADETINRVTLKAPKLAEEYVGDPALYFYAVAKRVYMEAVRRPADVAIEPPATKPDNYELELECLDDCLEKITSRNRELLLEYYKFDKRLKIDHRRELAGRFGIAQNALRIRAHRIRLTLQQCVMGCVAQSSQA